MTNYYTLNLKAVKIAWRERSAFCFKKRHKEQASTPKPLNPQTLNLNSLKSSSRPPWARWCALLRARSCH